MTCLREADLWIRQNAKGENCMVYVEDTPEARSAIRYAHRYHQHDDMRKLLPDDLKTHFPLRRIREDPAFQEKRPDHPLVLADFLAFVLKRRAMGDVKVLPFFDPWKRTFAALEVKEDRLEPS